MARNEDLPYWNPKEMEDDGDHGSAGRFGKGRVAAFALVGLAALLLMVGIGYLLGQSRSNEVATGDGESQLGAEPLDEEAQEQLTEDSAVSNDVDDTPLDETATGNDEAAKDVTLQIDDTEMNEGAVDSGDDSTSGDGADEIDADHFFPPGVERPDRYAVYADGKVYLKGKVPSQEVSDIIVDKSEAVVGPGNVVADYEIDPSVVIEQDSSAPLFVKDVVLFDFNSTEIAQPFLPLLDLGVVLLDQNPQASMTVATYTDSIGSETVNQDVSQLRGQAVRSYMVQQGANPDQIKVEARGEQGASPEDDPQTAAVRRRAEFIITGLLN